MNLYVDNRALVIRHMNRLYHDAGWGDPFGSLLPLLIWIILSPGDGDDDNDDKENDLPAPWKISVD